MVMSTEFPPTDDAWRARLERLDVRRYAASRNHLEGAVTGLSPYLTHGYLTLAEAAECVRAQQRFSEQDKLFSEFGWRSFFHHVWRHKGQAILRDLRPPMPGVAYAPRLPEDIRQGRTGLRVIDQAVATLYTHGYLHNHARMWLASYVVHCRHVHWRAGADWMVSHLLDGDLASNHLSWQWVAGTFSSKPYLFNAENVAKFAPASWHVRKSPLDTSYEALELLARGEDQATLKAFESLAAKARGGLEEPPVHSQPPQGLLERLQPKLLRVPLAEAVHVELVHAWALRGAPSHGEDGVPGKTFRLGVIHMPGHAAWPWSEQRWDFVLTRMSQICDALFIGRLEELDAFLPAGSSRSAVAGVGEPLTQQALAALKPTWCSLPGLLPEPRAFCGSFSKYFREALSASPCL
jgi:deoxyribodipyrimidine photo-lyase